MKTKILRKLHGLPCNVYIELIWISPTNSRRSTINSLNSILIDVSNGWLNKAFLRNVENQLRVWL